jgi:hypothetical protein
MYIATLLQGLLSYHITNIDDGSFIIIIQSDDLMSFCSTFFVIDVGIHSSNQLCSASKSGSYSTRDERYCKCF